jgi:hypothetical protein
MHKLFRMLNLRLLANCSQVARCFINSVSRVYYFEAQEQLYIMNI